MPVIGVDFHDNDVCLAPSDDPLSFEKAPRGRGCEDRGRMSLYWIPSLLVLGAVGPLVAAKLLGAGGAILVFIVVFAALASSLDSLLAATSDLILTDIYKGHFRSQAFEEELAKAARFVALGVGLFAWLVSRNLRIEPGPLQTVIEGIVTTIENAISAVAPQHTQNIMPFIGSLWIYLVIANLSGLIPGAHSPTRDLSATAALAFLVAACEPTRGPSGAGQINVFGRTG